MRIEKMGRAGSVLQRRLAISAVWCLLLSCPVAFSQSTWQGLRFGSKLPEVTTDLAAKAFSVQAKDKAKANVTPSVEIKINRSALGFVDEQTDDYAAMYFDPELHFDGQDGLDKVTLTLNPSVVMAKTPKLSNNLPMIAWMASNSIYQQLSSRYGKAASTRGTCENVDFIALMSLGKITDCAAIWRADGQSVSLHWQFDNSNAVKRLDFVITYNKQSDLL